MEKYSCDEQKVKKIGEELEELLRCRTRLREIFILNRDVTEVEYHCPIKIDRLINKIRATNTRYRTNEIVNPLFVYENTERVLNECLLPQSQAKYKELLSKYQNVEKESRRL